MSELLALAERCEAAAESSFYLDKEILAAFGFTWRGMDYWSRDNTMWKKKVHFTSSIDAAIDLVPADHAWTVSTHGTGPFKYWASVCVPDEDAGSSTATAATPALALCAAALRSRHPVVAPGAPS